MLEASVPPGARWLGLKTSTTEVCELGQSLNLSVPQKRTGGNAGTNFMLRKCFQEELALDERLPGSASITKLCGPWAAEQGPPAQVPWLLSPACGAAQQQPPLKPTAQAFVCKGSSRALPWGYCVQPCGSTKR